MSQGLGAAAPRMAMTKNQTKTVVWKQELEGKSIKKFMHLGKLRKSSESRSRISITFIFTPPSLPQIFISAKHPSPVGANGGMAMRAPTSTEWGNEKTQVYVRHVWKVVFFPHEVSKASYLFLLLWWMKWISDDSSLVD